MKRIAPMSPVLGLLAMALGALCHAAVREVMTHGEQRREETGMSADTAPLSERIVRLSCIEVDPARLTEYLEYATACGRASMAQEPGVLMMFSMQEKAHPERITILEIYADWAAYERHIRSEHFQTYKQGTLEMVTKLELLDQNPLVPEMKMK